jgi:TPP-dependent pyruvate/acetoin dehydrogenase alpha subunit
MITPEERTQIEERVDREVEGAAEFAENSPEPDPAGLMDFLYVDPRPNV